MVGEEGMEYVTREKGTEFYEQAAEPRADEFREVMLKTKEYEPKTARGKAAKLKRDEEKKPVKVAECVLALRCLSRSCGRGEEKSAVIELRSVLIKLFVSIHLFNLIC